MQLTAVFEHWHLGDGNYPAFRVGDEVRLSFEMAADEMAHAAGRMTGLVPLRDAEYEVVADVIKHYAKSDGSSFPVFQADWFRFYIPPGEPNDFAVGVRVRLRGTVALDHFFWVEFLERWTDPPDLFYGCRITRIRQVRIPPHLVNRSEWSMSHPASVGPADYAPDDVVDVAAVVEESANPAFSLLDLEILPVGAGPERPSFLGA
jgi:hypothetical protein